MRVDIELARQILKDLERDKWQDAFRYHLASCGVDGFVEEHQFHATRKWRFDFAWIDDKVAVEIEGAEFSRGRHQRPKGFADDCEKYNAAAIDGWMVLRFVGSEIKKNPRKCVGVVQTALQSRRE